MEQTFRFFLGVLLGVLLAVNLVVFVSFSSLSGVVEEEEVDGLVEDVVDVGVEEIVESEFNDSELNVVRNNLLDRCENANFVILGENREEIVIEIDCYKLEKVGKAGFEELIKEEVKKSIINKVERFGIENKLKLVKLASWIVGVISLVLALAIVFVTPPMAMLIIGISNLVVGLGFLAIQSFRDYVFDVMKQTLAEAGLGTVPTNIGSLVNDLASSAYSYLLVIFVVGAVFSLIGFIILVVLSGRKIKENKKRKKK